MSVPRTKQEVKTKIRQLRATAEENRATAEAYRKAVPILRQDPELSYEVDRFLRTARDLDHTAFGLERQVIAYAEAHGVKA